MESAPQECGQNGDDVCTVGDGVSTSVAVDQATHHVAQVHRVVAGETLNGGVGGNNTCWL